MDFGLKGKTAIVTGCSVGIGRVIAKELAREGVQTLITARRRELLVTLQDEIESEGGPRPVALMADLLDRTSAERISNVAHEKFGRVDILINNAGASKPLPLDASDEMWEDALMLGFTHIRKLVQLVLPEMRAQKWGRIISIGGSNEPAGINAMSATKAAVQAWSKGLSRMVGGDGITVNCLIPGRIHSEQIDDRMYPTPESQAEFSKNIPAGYFGDAEDFAYLVTCLCSPRARYINGQRIDIDGGLRRSI